MEEVQQVAWAVHAKSCFGDVSMWTSVEIKAVGSVIGKLLHSTTITSSSGNSFHVGLTLYFLFVT